MVRCLDGLGSSGLDGWWCCFCRRGAAKWPPARGGLEEASGEVREEARVEEIPLLPLVRPSAARVEGALETLCT